MTDIFDLKPIQKLDLFYFKLVLILLACLIGCMVFWIILRQIKKRRKSPSSIPIALSPQEKALQSLEKLAQSPWLQAGELRLFAFALSDLFRLFLEEQWRLKALDWTTEELVRFLRQQSDLTLQPLLQIEHWLTELDRVKFAQGATSAERMRQLIVEMRDHISSSTP